MDEKLQCAESETKGKLVCSDKVCEIAHSNVFEMSHSVHAQVNLLEVVLFSEELRRILHPQMLRRRPPSTGRETPRIAPAAGEARKAITDAVSRGSINRSIGTWLIQPS